LKIGPHIGGVLVAEVAIFFESFVDDAIEFGRRFRIEADRRSVIPCAAP
jgi:hypothetical protein